jgi:molybdopterin converting factor subunit 1
MIVCVRLFARAKDLAGVDSAVLQLPQNATVADVRQVLAADFPGVSGLLARCAVAVDGEFANDAFPISANAEVALLPPVSGGQC